MRRSGWAARTGPWAMGLALFGLLTFGAIPPAPVVPPQDAGPSHCDSLVIDLTSFVPEDALVPVDPDLATRGQSTVIATSLLRAYTLTPSSGLIVYSDVSAGGLGSSGSFDVGVGAGGGTAESVEMSGDESCLVVFFSDGTLGFVDTATNHMTGSASYAGTLIASEPIPGTSKLLALTQGDANFEIVVVDCAAGTVETQFTGTGQANTLIALSDPNNLVIPLNEGVILGVTLDPPQIVFEKPGLATDGTLCMPPASVPSPSPIGDVLLTDRASGTLTQMEVDMTSGEATVTDVVGGLDQPGDVGFMREAGLPDLAFVTEAIPTAAGSFRTRVFVCDETDPRFGEQIWELRTRTPVDDVVTRPAADGRVLSTTSRETLVVLNADCLRNSPVLTGLDHTSVMPGGVVTATGQFSTDPSMPTRFLILKGGDPLAVVDPLSVSADGTSATFEVPIELDVPEPFQVDIAVTGSSPFAILETGNYMYCYPADPTIQELEWALMDIHAELVSMTTDPTLTKQQQKKADQAAKQIDKANEQFERALDQQARGDFEEAWEHLAEGGEHLVEAAEELQEAFDEFGLDTTSQLRALAEALQWMAFKSIQSIEALGVPPAHPRLLDAHAAYQQGRSLLSDGQLLAAARSYSVSIDAVADLVEEIELAMDTVLKRGCVCSLVAETEDCVVRPSDSAEEGAPRDSLKITYTPSIKGDAPDCDCEHARVVIVIDGPKEKPGGDPVEDDERIFFSTDFGDKKLESVWDEENVFEWDVTGQNKEKKTITAVAGTYRVLVVLLWNERACDNKEFEIEVIDCEALFAKTTAAKDPAPWPLSWYLQLVLSVQKNCVCGPPAAQLLNGSGPFEDPCFLLCVTSALGPKLLGQIRDKDSEISKAVETHNKASEHSTLPSALQDAHSGLSFADEEFFKTIAEIENKLRADAMRECGQTKFTENDKKVLADCLNNEIKKQLIEPAVTMKEWFGLTDAADFLEASEEILRENP